MRIAGLGPEILRRVAGLQAHEHFHGFEERQQAENNRAQFDGQALLKFLEPVIKVLPGDEMRNVDGFDGMRHAFGLLLGKAPGREGFYKLMRVNRDRRHIPTIAIKSLTSQ